MHLPYSKGKGVHYLIRLFILLLLAISVHANKYVVPESHNTTMPSYCLILEANISGTVNYMNKQGKTVTLNFNVPEQVPTLADPKSKCGGKETLRIDFIPSGIASNRTEGHLWNITLNFAKIGNGAEGRYELANYELGAYMYSVLNATAQGYVDYNMKGQKPEWGATVLSQPNGFTCSKNLLPLTNESSLNFANLKLVAFAHQHKEDFLSSQVFEVCPTDVRTSDLVPIIVGAMLAGLVILVLVAYLIGRARAKRQGYASV